MFGAFNQQQPMQPQQNQFAPLQPAQLNYDGKQIHPYYLQQIQQILQFVHQAQNQPNLRNLMQFLEKEATTSKEVVDKASSYTFDSEQKMQNLEFNRSKCIRIKTRNSQILARLFNLRLKLTNNMNMYKTRSADKQQEIALIHQKIRDVKCSISYKYNRLKAIKNRNGPIKEDTPILRGSGLHVPLVQLKKGVQLLQRETIRLRQEIGLMEYPVSHFAKNINHPICNFMDQMQNWPRNEQKQAISFLSGDPTIYGMNSFRMPERGYEIVRENIMNENNHGYSASIGTPAFREAVTKLYNPKFPVTAADVQINHGVNMGLLAVLLAFTNQGDEVLVPQIGYPFYQDLCPAMKRKAVPYKLKKDCNFEIDLQHAASLINGKTSFMYVINPANPMGTVFTRAHMQEILSFSNQHELPLVVDQVYFKMIFPGVQALSFGQITEDVPVVVLSGVQKILSVPGWVQSWTVFFDKNDILKQIKQNLQVVATIFLHTNTFVQHSMPAILKEVGLFTNKQMPAIFQNYQYLSQRINKIKGLRAIPAQGTIYLAAQIDFSVLKDIENDVDFVRLLRQEQNVNILPLSVTGKSLQGLRLLTCAKEQFYDQFFSRVEAFIARHTKE